MKRNRTLEYPIFTMRLHKKTIQKLKKKKEKSGLSWNLFIFNLIQGGQLQKETNKK